MARHRISPSQAREFLEGRYGAVEELEPLDGGFWSSAYAFGHAGRELVVRFGTTKDWFEADRAAMAFSSAALPVPDVVEIGDAFDGAYAISVRHHGTNLEDLHPDQSEATGPLLTSLLAALFTVAKSPDLPVDWPGQPRPRDLTWRGWLAERLIDDPGLEVHGWREPIATQRQVDRLYRACEERVHLLLEACPERRDLVHGDLLHANVLVAEDASRMNAVFSWKCSLRADFLYDTAWCTFCSAIWYPGIAAADPWGCVRREPSIGNDGGAWNDASERHHCYELHIGLTALAWNVWAGDDETFDRIATHLALVLERGPLRSR